MIVLKKGREKSLNRRHPWIFSGAVEKASGKPGDTVEVRDSGGKPLALAAYSPQSQIRARVWTFDVKQAVDAGFFRGRIEKALALREALPAAKQSNALRLVNAESDGLPGIVVERYADYVVVQLFTGAVLGLRDELYGALEAELGCKAIYEQRRFKSLGGEAPRQVAAELVRGAAAPVELEVKEDDLTFVVDVTAPLSTGLFADLREGRRAVRQWASGRRVLNLFSYTGAISVYAQAGGAAEVCAVDVAAKAHARARRNFAASGFDPEKPEHIVGDAFKVLARFVERSRTFDMVVLDPPAFASAAARGGKPWSAVRDFAELVAASLDVLAPGGLLIAASSTHKMSAAEFELALADGAMIAGTRLQIIDRRSLPPDFPTVPGFPEASYLKFVVAVRG